MESWIVLAAFFLAGPVTSYLFFWYEAASGAHLERLKEVSGNRPGRWILRGLWTSVLSLFLQLLLRPLGLRRSLWHPPVLPSSSSGPAVILVHGLFHDASAWVFYRRWLKRAGFHEIHAWSYRSFGLSFDELTDQLRGRIGKAFDSRSNKEVVLVGHSLGGLLASACAAKGCGGVRMRALVTLGTPHGGSRLAAFGPGSLARSLLPRSPLLQRLRPLHLPADTPRLAVYSPVDNMVLPFESLRPAEDGWEEQWCAPVSHVAMLYHKGTARQVVDFLRRSLSSP